MAFISYSEIGCDFFGLKRNFKCLLSADESVLVIWLQDVVSKHTWQTARLQRSDIETAGSFLENGTLEDYANLFAESLLRQRTSMAWRNPDDPFADRVMVLNIPVTPRHFSLTIQPVPSDPSQKLNSMTREQVLALAQRLITTPQALEKAEVSQAPVEAPAMTDQEAVAGPSGAPIAAPVVSVAASGVCICANVTLEGPGHKIELKPIASSETDVAEFQDGAKMVFRRAGKYIVSISMGFNTSDITVPRGAALFELQDANGVTLAVNAPTSGCLATHIASLVHVAEVEPGDTLVVCAKNRNTIGGCVAIYFS